jgi:uncharacterized protein (DUF2141 family)
MFKFSLSVLFLFAVSAQAEIVTLKISNVAGEKGQLAVAAFSDPDAFPDQGSGAVLSKFFPVTSSQNVLTVQVEMKPGRYAIATYLDKNKNQKLDTNIVGAPRERFGFSQNPRITFSAPNFAECDFEVESGKNQVLEIKLNKLF